MNKNPASGQMCLPYLFAILSMLFSTFSYACNGLVFFDAWVREPPPVAKVAAAYLSITNKTDEDRSIDNFASDCCGHIMAHETIVEDGKTQMKHLSRLSIPAGRTVKLEPLGKHLMLMQPKRVFSNGDELVLKFHCGPEQNTEVTMPVIKQ